MIQRFKSKYLKVIDYLIQEIFVLKIVKKINVETLTTNQLGTI